MGYRDIWPFWYLGNKMVDFWTPGQTRGSEGIGQNASRAGRNHDILAILAPALLLSCFVGVFGYQNIDILVALAA